MKTLVVAEKPSVGRDIARVLGVTGRGTGCLTGKDYTVTWAVGHLVSLKEPGEVDERYRKWSMACLPMLPEKIPLKVLPATKDQFEVVKKLMNDAETEKIVCATDSGREGELIFRSVYELAGCQKPMKRLWISSMEDSAIREGFAHLKPSTEYDALYNAALCRERADWMVGINASRLFSCLYGQPLAVGRVMTPVLAMTVVREAAIAAFTPEKFYTVALTLADGGTASSKRFAQKADAELLLSKCRKEGRVTVQKMERKEKSESPPQLYDLTALQRDANRLLGFTAQQTLDYAQSLYEKRLITYPRTDSRFLTDDLEASVPELAAVAAAICETDAPGRVNAKQVCDSKKVSDHHAILPTAGAGKADVSVLPLGERELLRLVAGQLLRAVSDAHRYAETTVTLECGGIEFTAKGRTVLDTGWKRYLAQEKRDAALPELSEGQVLDCTEAAVKEGKTTPPKHFTEDTLLSAMENAGKDDTPEDAERKGLGTPATRAAIIEKLVATGFVERKRAKKAVSLVPAHTGVSLITVLPEQLQSPLLTAEWEYRLQQVERGELSPDEFMTGIADMLTELVKTYQVISGAEVLFPSGREVIGKCPRCGSDVTESKKGFFCEKNDCRFGLWRDNKFFAAKRAALTKKVAAALLADGRVKLTGLYSEKTGGTYDATAVLEDTGESVRFRLEFDKGART